MAVTKILHIAPSNTSGVPGQLVLTERRMGYDSRLVTLFHDKRKYYEDICLHLPFIDFWGTKLLKKIVSNPDKIVVDNVLKIPDQIPVQWKPHSLAEKALTSIRDMLWKTKIESTIKKYNLLDFDVVQLDGGLGFYRHSGFVKKMKANGKKIICLYTGSDLRTRGVIPAVEKISDYNFTVEYDHMQLHPNIKHVFFPFDAGQFKTNRPKNTRIRVGHAPTNRRAKGSDIIVPILRKLAYSHNIEPVIIQNLPYTFAMETKQTCDIFIDQIGDLGYGINSLEALAMGIPCCSCLAKGFAETYPDHPFVEIDADNLEEKLIDLINDTEKRTELGIKGREWVEKYHDAKNIVKQIHEIAGID